MEDVATLKVAFQEKTRANAISYLPLQSGCSTTTTNSFPPSLSLSLMLFLGTATSWQVVPDE